MDYLKAFLVGGLLCLIGQILIDKTKLTPARILVGYVVAGVVLGAVGVYKPLVEFAGAGASVPLTGFGYNLAKGVKEAVTENGFLGIFTGGLKATAGGICRELRASEKAPGAERIYTAGEKEYLAWQDRKDKGVPVGESIQREFIALRDECGLDYRFPFED